jgi:hypothetical protein
VPGPPPTVSGMTSPDLKVLVAVLAFVIALVSICGAIYLTATGHGGGSLAVGVGGPGVAAALFKFYAKLTK